MSSVPIRAYRSAGSKREPQSNGRVQANDSSILAEYPETSTFGPMSSMYPNEVFAIFFISVQNRSMI